MPISLNEPRTQPAEPTFEAALRELEEVVTALETGNVPLEASIALLQRGMALADQCDQTLAQAEATLEQLIANSDGELVTQRLDYDTDEGHVKVNKIHWRYAPDLVETALARILPEPTQNDTLTGHARLRQAMRYAVFSGGKRLRSQLVLETAGVVSAGFDALKALPAACALEIIHAYSLVHDDLPSMDNADTRRGRPSCHKAFDEATAILVGDALLTIAFEIVADDKLAAQTVTGDLLTVADAGHNPGDTIANAPNDKGRVADAALRLRALGCIARAAGEAGMVGGQAADIAWSHGRAAQVSGAQLLQMHALKTGALIRCACEVGALLGGGSAAQIRALTQYGEHLGRAFQIQDDVLDVEGDPQLTGKSATDTANYKLTAPAFFGLAEAKKLAREASDAAIAALQGFGDHAEALRQLACFVVQREK